MTARIPATPGLQFGDDWLTAGSPCPEGCQVGWPGQREPELLVTNIDGELSCPTCWECFGIVAAVEAGTVPATAAEGEQ